MRRKRYRYREPVFTSKFTVFLIVLAVLSVGVVVWLYFGDTYSSVAFASESVPAVQENTADGSRLRFWRGLRGGQQANNTPETSESPVTGESNEVQSSGLDDEPDDTADNITEDTATSTEVNENQPEAEDNAVNAEQDDDNTNIPANNTEESPSQDISRITTVDNSLLPWYLKLVNRYNFLEYDFMPYLRPIGNGHYFDARAYTALLDMLASARAEGLSPIVVSSFRSVSRQTTLFNNRIQRFVDYGYSEEDAFEAARRIVAYPGTSEHNLGLAVDIVSNSYHGLTARQSQTAEGQWLAANSYRYGFVLRYPYDKQHITNIIYEPWHFRYVGIYAATEMFARGLVLEEYVSELLAGR